MEHAAEMNVTRQWYENYQARRAASGSKSQRLVRNESVAEKEGKTKDSARYVVRITSYRVRFCDPDNLTPKWFIDSLRYAGAIPDDRPQDIELHVSQEKVKSKTDERTEITITPI